MFRTVPLSIIRSFSLYTQQWYVSHRFAVPSWSCSQAVSKHVWHIPLLCVQWKTPDDGQRNCPKHVEFYSKNKFEELVHLVGFVIRIPSWSCSQAVSKHVWHIPLLCVQWKTPDDGQRNCPKHVEFYSTNKFEKLEHLVGFIIRILSWSCSQTVSNTVWHIPLLCVQWKTPDDGQRNCPKHVEFYSTNKFEKLEHLVGFIIRIPSWSCSQAVSKTVWHTIAECTVENSWWWTEELPETCRVLFQK